MPIFRFIPQTETSLGEFNISGDSFEDAVDGLEFELQCHDEWKVVPQDDGAYAVDIFLKGHFIDTLLASELPKE